MPFLNSTAIDIENITGIINSTNLVEMGIKVSWTAYDGYLYFFLMLALFVIIYMKAQDIEDQPLKNAMDSATYLSIIVIIYKGVEIYYNGNLTPLMTDFHMWIFPVMSAILALINYATRKE